MTQATQLLDTYPADLDRNALTHRIDECFTCAQACTPVRTPA